MSKSTRAYMHHLQASLNHHVQTTHCGPPSTTKHQISSQETCSTNYNCKIETLYLTAKLLKIHLTPASLHTAFEGLRNSWWRKAHQRQQQATQLRNRKCWGVMNEAFSPEAGYLLAGCCGVQPTRTNTWQGEPAALSTSPSTVFKLGN